MNLQKLTLWAWDDPASIPMLAPAQNMRSMPPVTTTTFTVGMFKTETLHGVVQLDVDSQVIGVHLQLVVIPESAGRIYSQLESGNRTFHRQCPVPVVVRMGSEVNKGSWAISVTASVSTARCRIVK